MARLPKVVTDLIAAVERLPGMGPKSATRLVFYLLNTPEGYVADLAKKLMDFKQETKICPECFSVSTDGLCSICRDSGRDKQQICVVERAIDVMALEKVGGYRGLYHVLGGVINPLNHVGPEELKIEELLDRIKDLTGEIEIILATNPTMEGEATALYIKKKLDGKSGLKISRIGSGLPMGADLGYADSATLSRALEGRREI